MNYAIISLALLITSITQQPQTPRLTFMYENAGIAGKSGSVQFYNKDGKQLFDVKSSAGFNEYANNPYFQQTKDKGPIPHGEWFIKSVKDKDLAILRLEPGPDVIVGDRTGFLIHGQGENKSIEESSHGCIILEKQYREIILKHFNDNGKKPIPVKVWAIVSDSNR